MSPSSTLWRMPEDLQAAAAVEEENDAAGPPSGPRQRGHSSSPPLLLQDALLERELDLMHASACARYSLPGQQQRQGASGGVATGTARGMAPPSEYGVQEESLRWGEEMMGVVNAVPLSVSPSRDLST